MAHRRIASSHTPPHPHSHSHHNHPSPSLVPSSSPSRSPSRAPVPTPASTPTSYRYLAHRRQLTCDDTADGYKFGAVVRSRLPALNENVTDREEKHGNGNGSGTATTTATQNQPSS
jgi:hypothetical protein